MLSDEEPPGIAAAPLAAADHAAWLALIAEAFGAERGSASGLATFWRRFPGPRETLVLAEGGIAVATVSIRHVAGNTHGYVHLLAVRGTHRRRGLGLAMICCALHRLARDGARRAFTGTERPDAIRLYRRMGFTPVEDE